MESHIKTVEHMDIMIAEKVDLVLLLLGEKYATEVVLDSDEYPDDSPAKRIDRNAVRIIGHQLDTLPLVYTIDNEQLIVTLARSYAPTEAHLVDDGRTRITIHIAADQNRLEQLSRSVHDMDHATLGYLYGFPDTAVEAFVNNRVGDDEQLPEETRKSVAYEFAQFRFSRNNWRQELATGQRWADLLRQHSSFIYREFLLETPTHYPNR